MPQDEVPVSMFSSQKDFAAFGAGPKFQAFTGTGPDSFLFQAAPEPDDPAEEAEGLTTQASSCTAATVGIDPSAVEESTRGAQASSGPPKPPKSSSVVSYHMY